MAVMKSTLALRSSKVIAGYTPIKRPSQRNALTTTIRRPTIIKRSTPLQSTVAAAVKPPSVTAEAKFASANTTLKDAIATFDSILSSISGSFPPGYQKSLQEAMNTIHAATSAITATVEVAQLLPSQQLLSPSNGIISTSVPPPAPEITTKTLDQDSAAATDEEQNIATTSTDESPEHAPLASTLPPSYNYSNYLTFQELSLTKMTSDETRQPLNVIV